MKRKTIVSILLFYISILFLANNSFAQSWKMLGGPMEASIVDIQVANDSVYVITGDGNDTFGSLGGIFKRALDSNDWKFTTVPSSDFLSLAVGNDGTYYVGAYGVMLLSGETEEVVNQFFISRDYGKTWLDSFPGLETCFNPKSMLLNGSETLLLGCSDGVFMHSNDTDSFDKVGNKNDSNSLFKHGNTIIHGTEVGVEYSDDDGDTWVEAGPDSINVKAITYGFGGYIFAADNGLYTANNLDDEFTLLDIPDLPSINYLQTIDNAVIVGADNGLFQMNEELEFQPIFPDLNGIKITALSAYNNDVFVGTKQGFYVCNTLDNTCFLDGVQSSEISDLSIVNDTLLVSAYQTTYRYSLLTNKLDDLNVPEQLRTIAPKTTELFYGANLQTFHKCSFSSESCETVPISGLGNRFFNNDFVVNLEAIYVSTSEKVLQSKDDGESWNVIAEALQYKFDGLTAFRDSLLFINGGISLRYNMVTGAIDTLERRVSLITDDGTLFGLSTDEGVYKSTDSGATWTTILNKKHYPAISSVRKLLFDENSRTLYAVFGNGMIYVSKDDGKNWGINDEMSPIDINSAIIGADGTLYLGTHRAGVFYNTEPLDPQINVSNEIMDGTHELPKDFIVKQNYPNPFNPSTTIPFELAQPAEVNMTLYNVFGQKVAEYNLGYKNAGSHQYQILFDNYASGIYFLNVSAGDKSQILRMTFIK